MTKRDQLAKQEILKILAEEGYVTYAKLFDLFDLNLTKDPEVVGYMEPGKARIVVNENLNIDQVSFIVRHEILHEYLDHQLRMKKHMGDDAYEKRSPAIHKLINMAADWEISNRGYTDKDKRTAKRITIGDKVVQGLVTDIDHPDWVNLSLEQMFDKLNDEYKKNQQAMEQMLKELEEAGMLDIGEGAGSASQQMEDIEREAQEAAEQAEASGDSDSEQTASSIAKAAGKAGEEAEKQEKDKSSKVFDSEKEKQKQQELADKINRIKKAFKKAVENEVIDKEKEIKDISDAEKANRKEIDKYNNDPLVKFKLSLNQFIKKEIAVGRGPTWKRFNKKYANSDVIKPGSSRLRQNKVPLINVYFDRSGSWDDAKTRDGDRAMSFLHEYVRRGQIQVDTYYFSRYVHVDRKAAEAEGSTYGQPILDHITKTKPDNVIIMTDSDITDCVTDVTVPGAVYFLFKGGESQNLMNHLHGKRLTQKFDI